MKAIITVIVIFLLSFTLGVAQEFAPIGAKWYIQLAEPEADEWSGTMTNESLRDTFVKGLNCKVIYKSQATIFNEIFGEYILCQSGDSILHYIPSLDSLNLVMDFGANVGESWESFDQANNYEAFGFMQNYKYVVDSISYMKIEDNDSLRVQYLSVFQKAWEEPHSSYYLGQTAILIERLGFKSALLPKNNGDGFTDDIFETDIRCYEDPIIGLVKITTDENCLTSSVVETNMQSTNIFPNPSSGIIFIEDSKELDFKKIIILNEMGSFVESLEFNNSINISHLSDGIYLLQLVSNDLIITKRITIIH